MGVPETHTKNTNIIRIGTYIISPLSVDINSIGFINDNILTFTGRSEK